MGQKKIALVDDDPEFAKMLKAIFQSEGLDLETYAGQSDLTQCELDQVELLIIDYDLETLTGVEIADFLDQRGLDIPVLLISYTKREAPIDWPDCVRAFALKSEGPKALAEQVKKILHAS